MIIVMPNLFIGKKKKSHTLDYLTTLVVLKVRITLIYLKPGEMPKSLAGPIFYAGVRYFSESITLSPLHMSIQVANFQRCKRALASL